MLRHINYLKYILRHKWFVFVASLKIGSPIWLAIIHDMSKFYPSEWFPYAETFYKRDGSKQYNETIDFNYAWNHHQKRNKHHWQYWLLEFDRGETKALKIPRKYLLEMIADWMGAGRAITGEWEVVEWYQKNKKNMTINEETKIEINKILSEPDASDGEQAK